MHLRPPTFHRSLVVALVTAAAGAVTAWASPSGSVTAPTAAAPNGAGAAGPGSAGVSGDAALLPGAAAPLGTTTRIGGLDVSHWQGAIDWAKVGGTERRFVFMKATDDTDYVDPRFVTNRAGAHANGLAVGAYHFARPDPSSGDAVQEAKHFASVADPRPGELLPVLDIETSRHLDQDELTRWALRWAAEVRDRTGVTPLVYTSPNGWKERFGDTKRLARAGSPLWVAHWGVSSPLVPAGDWDGHGWVVWQHSSTGHVAGIKGDVDLDKLVGANLGVITIRRLGITVEGDAGRVTSAPGGYGCASTCVRNVDPDITITLTAEADPGAFFTGWGGACAGTAPTCSIAMHGNRQVSASFVTDITPPTSTLAPPQRVNEPAVVRFDEIVHGVTAGNVGLRPAGGDASSRIDAHRSCRAGSGVVVDCATGNVRTVRLLPVHPLVPGRDYEAVIDPPGVPKVRDRVGNVAAEAHLSFEGALRIEQHDPTVEPSWRTAPSATAFGGSYAVERQAGASSAFAFRGGSVTWYTVTGPAFGKADVRIDGHLERTVDLYAPSRHSRVARSFSRLGRGRHVLTIRVLGHGRPASTDHLVAVDAFRAGSRGLIASPVTSETWRAVRAAGASGGSFDVADLAGAAVTARFDGPGIDWTSITGPDRGRARIMVDGVTVDTVDLYSPSRTFGVVTPIRGLAPGPHVLRIVATGTAHAESDGTLVPVDRFDVVSGP
jgi:GH25 family lysozyme M1 (1,4-beta-N-acetylmuramidase)